MPKINREEYEVLKELDDKWKWIARDKTIGVCLFTNKPERYMFIWSRDQTFGKEVKELETNLFQFIQWEDENPHNIQELIEEYEDNKLEERLDKAGIPASVIERVDSFEEESEETEVKKDKKWFIEEMDSMYMMRDTEENPDEWFISKPALLKALEQLDEPETLSQEWIETYSYVNPHVVNNEDRMIPYVYAEDLQDLLVPKQEHLTDTLEDGVYVVKDGKMERGNIATEYTDKGTEVKKDKQWFKERINDYSYASYGNNRMKIDISKDELDDLIDQFDEPEQQKITLQDVTGKLWELPLNNRKFWLARLNDEFQEGYIVPLGLKTTDGEEQYLTYNGSYFASRRNKYLQQTFDTLEEIPEFYRELAERVL